MVSTVPALFLSWPAQAQSRITSPWLQPQHQASSLWSERSLLYTGTTMILPVLPRQRGSKPKTQMETLVEQLMGTIPSPLCSASFRRLLHCTNSQCWGLLAKAFSGNPFNSLAWIGMLSSVAVTDCEHNYT